MVSKIDKEPNYNAKFFSDLFNVTERYVQALATDGVIPKAARAKYPLFSVVRGYVKFLQDRQSRGTLAPEKQDDKLKLVSLKRERAELDLELFKGALIRVEDVRDIMTTAASTLRSRLDSIPGTAGPVVISLSAADAAATIKELINEGLQEFVGTEVVADAISQGSTDPGAKSNSIPMGRRKSSPVKRGK